MKYVRNLSTNAHYNMAFDDFCLEKLPLEEPIFCLWQNAPSVIIGLNQNALSEVNLPYLEEHDILLARRVTGGGAVYHDLGNLNYTIVGRSSDLERDYPGYLTFVIHALRELGVDAELSGRNDILVGGRKVSGYAKRVWKDRLMVHGTLMFDVDLEALTHALSVPGSKFEASGIASVRSRVTNLRDHLPQMTCVQDLADALEEILSRHHADDEIHITTEQKSEIEEIYRTKFATWEWNIGRDPKATFKVSHRFPCGTIEAHISVEHGIINALDFGGDFIGNAPAKVLADALLSCRFDRASLLTRLSDYDISTYFDRLDTDTFVTFLLS